MKKWWYWLIQSAIWVLVTILNARDGRSALSVGWNAAAALIFAGLAVAQYFCDRNGEKGKKTMKIICICTLAALLTALGAALVL